MGPVLGTLCMKVWEPCCGCATGGGAPYLPQHLTAPWLEGVLKKSGALSNDNSIDTLDLKAFAVGEGLMSIMYRITVTYYIHVEGLPTTFVAKLTPPAAKARVLGELLNLFRNEVSYYNNDVGEVCGLSSPRCYYAGHSGYGRHCLILEDLAPASVGNQIEGLSIERAREAVAMLAKLHAAFWGKATEHPKISDWLLRVDDFGYWKLVKQALDGATKDLHKTLHQSFKVDGCDGLLEFADRFAALYPRFVQHMAKDNTARSGDKSIFTTTLIHGDFRCENIFFDVPSRGGEEEGTGLMAVDFQLMKEACGESELAYFLISSLTTETRRKHEVELVELYYDLVRKGGVKDYDMGHCLRALQLGVVTPFIINVIAAKDTAGDGSERGLKLLKLGFERLDLVVSDWKFKEAMETYFGDGGKCNGGVSGWVSGEFTDEEMRSVLAPHWVALWEKHGGGASSAVAAEDVKVVA